MAMSILDMFAVFIVVFPLIVMTAAILILPVLAVRSFISRKRDRNERIREMQKTEQSLLAHGPMKGPKGPYVPHKKWGAGTPHETAPRGAKAYNGDFWP